MGYERTPSEVVVVTGVGDMGSAAARRLAAGRQLVLADWSEGNLRQRAEDIAAVEEFLVSAEASLITGTDILVDEGIISALRYGDAAQAGGAAVPARHAD